MNVELKIHPGNAYDFSIKEKLNSKLWIGKELRLSIRERLLLIAEEFVEYLEIVPESAIVDIQFTGSLANYNYTVFSDIDLHVIIDLNEVGEQKDLIASFLKARRATWNNRHNIKVKGYEVELYAQDAEEEHASTGVYSVLNDVWVEEPKVFDFIPDIVQISNKAISFQERLYDILRGPRSSQLEKLKLLKQKIIKMRRAGLHDGGEFSNENLSFKVLRRIGFLKRLGDEINKIYDRELSLNGGK
jgi:predicted nucleotidyltransferase